MLALVAKVPQISAGTLSCPANVSTANGTACGKAVNYPAPSTSGNVGPVLCTPASGSFFPVGKTAIACHAISIDLGPPVLLVCGFDVTVLDTRPPSITCPPDQELHADLANECGAVFDFEATATDECAGVTSVQIAGLPPGSTFPIGKTVNVFRAIDGSGNTATCSASVRVDDVDPPRLTCPGTVNVSQPGPVEYDVAAADCSPVDVSLSPPSGSTFAVGTTVVTATARDSLGHDAFCAFAVVVEKPVSAPGDCQVTPTFASVKCRLDALRPVVTAVTTDPARGRLTRVLDRVRTLVLGAESALEAGHRGPARAALRRAIARMGRFRRAVTARKSGLDAAARTALLGQADALAVDLQTLRGS